MKKVAVLCAYPSRLNPGMLSVDFALDDVVSQFSDHIFDRFCLEASFKIPSPSGMTQYAHLHNIDQLSGYDSIIYWGDFLQWIGYGKHDFLIRQMKRYPAVESSKISDLWFELCLLEGSQSLQEKSIIFGSTIYGLNANQLVDQRYLESLSSLYKRAKLIQLRDSLSACFAKQITGKDDDFLGCDCAFLLDTSTWESNNAMQQPYILCSFSRSGGASMLQAFANIISAISKIKVVYINWLDDTGFDGLKTKISLIKNAKLVVTDIYHLSVTALRERTPIICIGRGAQTPINSTSDKKKEVLFYQSMLSTNYLFFEEIYESMHDNAKILKLGKRMTDIAFDESSRLIAQNFLIKQVSKTRDRLRHAIQLI